ncbi:QueT transporter family protein [Pseudobutyrivibrio sp.]|uniref:QueT transporter family protein n=1 Tax=Pseudobutyrivibrio sp. TaxID=2014367 RepID=UPI0025F98DA2|nr:QueT transporter family protein [Pseudobutyrivibrio sp.]MBR5649002.1 QueT transporter family protein [Pseudobutyrivibrio sp.]
MKQHDTILKITQGAMIAALYVVLTWVANALGLANGAIQVRFSEALCILPIFTPAAIPGLFVGCLLANILNGCVIWDIIFGSLATLIGAFGTYFLRKTKFVFTLPPVIANAVIVPFVLRYAYGVGDAHWYLVATVAAGEIISVCILGLILKLGLWKYRKYIF